MYSEMCTFMHKSEMTWKYYINYMKFEKRSTRSRENSNAPKLPVGPAKEERWRRVLRTTDKNVFLMRWSAVKQ